MAMPRRIVLRPFLHQARALRRASWWVAPLLGLAMLALGSASVDRAGASAPSEQLKDHGGKVIATSDVYVIWWGTASSFPSDTRPVVTSVLNGLNGSNYYNLLNQYLRGASATTTLKASVSDTSTPPRRTPRVSALASEVAKMVRVHKWTADPNGVYIVITSNFPSGSGTGTVDSCGTHYHSKVNGVDVAIAYVPNSSGVRGCDPGSTYAQPLLSEGTLAITNVLTHALFEAVSDPDDTAWHDVTGGEIADKCAWQFSAPVKLSTGSFQLPEMWSNQAGGCVQD